MNKSLFVSKGRVSVPKTDTVNEAGGTAYKFTPKHTLAQYALTGCLNSTFYVNAETQLDTVLGLCADPLVGPEFIAKTAIYARKNGYMKDMPSLLVAILAVISKNKGQGDFFKNTFHRVIDNGKMLSNFVQMIRSGSVKIGSTSRKSFGTSIRNQIRSWIQNLDERELVNASVGINPSLADIIKMVHAKPKGVMQDAMFKYVLGKEYNKSKLPKAIRQYEAFKSGDSKDIPDVPFQMLTSLTLGTDAWTEIAKNGGWHMLRMNLNTFKRHGVFEDTKMVKSIAKHLCDEESIRKSKVFPYQLLTTYRNVEDVPIEIREALQDAMEIAISNVPTYKGKVFVFPDVSGSMSSPATGDRGSVTSKTRCIDVAALVAAAVLRNNKDAEVIPFESQIVTRLKLNPRDSVMTNATKLASIGGGGTNCSAPLQELNRRGESGDLIIYVSDNESWVDSNGGYKGSATIEAWKQFKKKSPKAKMVCIDIQPNGSSQTSDSNDILNVGGFSDRVFDVINEFVTDNLNADHFVDVIEKVDLE